MFQNKNIVLGVTGCSSAYKAVDLATELSKLGANVDVVMTESATHFISPVSFRRPTNNPVAVDLFAEPSSWDKDHKSLAEKADLLLIAPASANLIGKAANGIADDMLTTLILSTEARTVIAPHMNPKMYNKPILKRNIQLLQENGFFIVEQEKLRKDGVIIKSMLADIDFIINKVSEIINI